MNNVDTAVEQLITAIIDSEIYKEYDLQRNKVNQFPDLKARIDDYRCRVYEMQASGKDAFAKIDQLEREYAGFKEEPLVSDFLAAELAFCRLMQDIETRISEAANFE